MSKITNHPELTTLAHYVSGQLEPLAALMVAAHVDLCCHCQQQVAALEARQAQAWLAQEVAVDEPQLEGMLQQILAAPAVSLPQQQPVASPLLHVADRQFALPRALRRFAADAKPWRRLGSKLWQSRLVFGPRHLQLLYMDVQGQVPEHTHKGQELTLVLHGGFADADGEYQAGDLILRTGEHRHAPTASHESCLCIALTDAPLHFTSGVGRLLNPIARWL